MMNTKQSFNYIKLSPVIVDALQNDKQLIELHKRLNELYSITIPIVIQVTPTEFKTLYSDEFNELIAKFHKEINFRQEQIVSFYVTDNIKNYE